MIEKDKDKDKLKEENESKKGEQKKSGRKRVKKGSKQDRKRNRKVVFWVLMITVVMSLIFYLSAWWNEGGMKVVKKEDKGVEMKVEKEKDDDFLGGWGKPAVYEF